VNSYKTDPVTGLPMLDSYNSTNVTNDMRINSTDPFTPYAGTLDPRLDWTVGRRGIPYKDWGIHPGKKWIRDQDFSGPFSPKKNVWWQANKAFYDASSWAPGTAINYSVIRFADLLLMAAEANAQLNMLPEALVQVNRVRNRAANPVGWVYTYVNPATPTAGFTTTPAANYKISPYTAFASKDEALKAIYFERKLELAMEGHRFFDLSRWGIAESTLNAFFAFEGAITNDIKTGKFTPNKNEIFPVPQGEIDKTTIEGVPTLVQNPNYK
jgi:hypothetical protein